jgi:hypothetical protein
MNSYNGFYKVAENNGGVCVGTFYNPDTQESFTKITWDIDDIRLDQDEEVQIYRYMPINKDVRRLWLHRAGVIQEGDQIKVVKGRKVPIGTVATVKEIKPFYDRYRRWQADYLYLDNGMKTNINNCVLA